MESLLYSVNVTVPVFSMMILGCILRRAGIIHEEYVKDSNRLTFRVLLPVMLFNSMRGSDFRGAFDLGFLLFCFLFLIVYPCTVWLIASRFIQDRRKLGAFVQGTFRGNTAVIGLSVAQNIYGMDLGLMPLMLGVAMLMYNAVSVVIPGAVLYMPFAELVDLKQEKERLQKEEKRLQSELARVNGMLKNEKFLAKAPETKVAEEKAKLEKYTQMMQQVQERLSQL